MEIFDGIPKNDSQEATYEAVERVSSHPERRDFKQGFRRLESLYEAVAPDGRLVSESIQDEYKWLSRIHVAFQRTTSGKTDPEKEMQEKTRRIINDHVEINQIKDDFPTYKLGTEYLEDADGLENPGVKAAQIAHATQDHLHPRENQNPRYKRLSERVTDIVERWQGDEIGDPEAVEALKQVESDVLRVEEEAEEQGMDDAEFAIYTHLTEEVSDDVGLDKAGSVAAEIVSEFHDRVDRDYPGWRTNKQTRTEITQILFDVLLVEHDLRHLIQDDDSFIDDIRGYLLQNYE
jgi:type I restriction enzyme R subunit